MSEPERRILPRRCGLRMHQHVDFMFVTLLFGVAVINAPE
jgi:hypothetical protein